MNKEIELLAPGGDVDAAKAAILAGANAIYCGLDRFNARNSAANISFENLQGILRLAHKNNCEVFLTLNIIIVESEIPALITLLNKLVNTTIDGIIIQDLGMFYLLNNYFKSFKIHASTQLTTHNEGQIKFLNRLNVSRVNLSRELNITEIKYLTKVAHQNNILTEVFVHGSNCISFSGLCYMSSLNGGNSGNRGRCSQPCRDQYIKTEVAKDFPLNLKDNSAFFDLKELADAGVDSLKIEGRIKKFDYVFTVVNAWRKQLDSYYKYHKLINDNSALYKVFNRDFSNTFLKGDIHKDMFIDNPRDHSIKHLSEINNFVTVDEIEKAHLELYAEKDKIKNFVENAINQISIDKRPLIIFISGEYGKPLKLTIKTPDKTFVIFSESNLENQGTEALSKEMLLKRLKAINNTEFYIEHLELDNFQTNLYLPFNELTAIKKKILFLLNGSSEIIAPVEVPKLIKQENDFIETELTILISSVSDVFLGDENDVKIYFQLPESFKDKVDEYVSFFEKNKKLIPWFPSVLIGDDYKAAVNFLLKLNP